jgi:type I restriction enzyme R subunit
LTERTSFTIYDFVDAYHHFADPEWDRTEPCDVCGKAVCECPEFLDQLKALLNLQSVALHLRKTAKHKKCGELPCSCEKRKKIK